MTELIDYMSVKSLKKNSGRLSVSTTCFGIESSSSGSVGKASYTIQFEINHIKIAPIRLVKNSMQVVFFSCW